MSGSLQDHHLSILDSTQATNAAYGSKNFKVICLLLSEKKIFKEPLWPLTYGGFIGNLVSTGQIISENMFENGDKIQDGQRSLPILQAHLWAWRLRWAQTNKLSIPLSQNCALLVLPLEPLQQLFFTQHSL